MGFLCQPIEFGGILGGIYLNGFEYLIGEAWCYALSVLNCVGRALPYRSLSRLAATNANGKPIHQMARGRTPATGTKCANVIATVTKINLIPTISVSD